MTLTKAQIVDIIHEELPFPKNKSTEVVEGLIEMQRSAIIVYSYDYAYQAYL